MEDGEEVHIPDTTLEDSEFESESFSERLKLIVGSNHHIPPSKVKNLTRISYGL